MATVTQMAVKRMANRKLASGWTAWHGGWAEARRQTQMLASAGARLLKPKLAASIQLWRAAWEAAAKANARERGRAAAAAKTRGESAEVAAFREWDENGDGNVSKEGVPARDGPPRL